MALRKTVDTPFGITVNDAYHRVSNIQITNKTQLQFVLESSVDGQLPSFASSVHICNFDIDSFNPIKQAYLCAKKLPEYDGAIDC